MKGAGPSIVLLGVVACSRPAPGPVAAYDAARAACGLEPGDHVDAPWGPLGAGDGVSEACAEKLADDAGLKWSSFDEAPHDVTGPDSYADLVVGGLYTLVAADVGTVADVRDGGFEAARVLDDGSLGTFADDDDAGAFYYGWLLDRIRAVRRERGERYEDAGLLAAEVHRDIVFAAEPVRDDEDASPPSMATVLVHETAHVDNHGHVEDEDGQHADADGDGSGSYGVQVGWIDGWIDRNPTSAWCATAAKTRGDLCERIEDTSGIVGCEEPARCQFHDPPRPRADLTCDDELAACTTDVPWNDFSLVLDCAPAVPPLANCDEAVGTVVAAGEPYGELHLYDDGGFVRWRDGTETVEYHVPSTCYGGATCDQIAEGLGWATCTPEDGGCDCTLDRDVTDRDTGTWSLDGGVLAITITQTGATETYQYCADDRQDVVLDPIDGTGGGRLVYR